MKFVTVITYSFWFYLGFRPLEKVFLIYQGIWLGMGWDGTNG